MDGGQFGGQFRAATGKHFDRVILAVPATPPHNCFPVAARNCPPNWPPSITVPRSPSASAMIATCVKRCRPAFGFLVPRSEGKRLLAATFVHNKFPHRAPQDRALLRWLLTGTNADEVWGLRDDQIIGTVRNDLQKILGLRAEPVFARVYKWKSAMAQYAWAIWRGWSASNACGNSYQVWPSRATAIAAWRPRLHPLGSRCC